jgi:hypothetical protein
MFPWHSIAIPRLTTLKADFSLRHGYFARCATKLDNLSHCGRITVAWIKAEPCRPSPLLLSSTSILCSRRSQESSLLEW